jgi:hypothetical protein
MSLASLVRLGSVLSLVALGGSAMGCGDSCGDVSCSDGESLYLELGDELPTGGTVEVCFEDSCSEAEMYGGGELPDKGEVRYAALGRWSDNKDAEVTVTVREADGTVSTEVTGVPEKRGSCCGDYWTAKG